jgi:hypothetical protein
MYTLLGICGNMPTFIRVRDGKVNDVNVLDEIEPHFGMNNIQETYEDRTP